MKKYKISNYTAIALYAMLAVVSSLIFSCSEDVRNFKSSKLELRQLVQQTETKKTSSASYFFLIASYGSSEVKYTTVKVFAKVEKRFRLIEIPIEDVRISINNKLINPNIEIEYKYHKKLMDEELINLGWISKVYVINCPEQFLPEKLLPIGL